MLSHYKRFFMCIFIFLALFVNTPAIASDAHKSNDLMDTTLREWKKAPQKEKFITCLSFILATMDGNYFKLPVHNLTQLSTYTNQLIFTINSMANSNGSTYDNDSVAETILAVMLTLGWIDESFTNALFQAVINDLNNLYAKNPKIPQHNNEVFRTNPTTPSKSMPKPKSKPKRKLMSKNEGRAWVKKNLHLRANFPLDELVQRFGQYEKKIAGNSELYYFKRIDMTFFLLNVRSHLEFVGFAYGNSGQ